jgi:hypothetical protein
MRMCEVDQIEAAAVRRVERRVASARRGVSPRGLARRAQSLNDRYIFQYVFN